MIKEVDLKANVDFPKEKGEDQLIRVGKVLASLRHVFYGASDELVKIKMVIQDYIEQRLKEKEIKLGVAENKEDYTTIVSSLLQYFLSLEALAHRGDELET